MMGWTPRVLTVDDLPDPARLPSVVALDTETYDPLLHSHGPGWAAVPAMGDDAGWVRLVSLAWRADGALQTGVLVWRTEEGEHTATARQTRAWLRAALPQPHVTWALFASPYDLGWLVYGERMPWPARWRDAQALASLLDEHRRTYALDDVAVAWLGPDARKDETALREEAARRGWDPKRDLWRLPLATVAPYAQQDAALTWRLVRAMAPRVVQELPERLRDVEHDVQRVLVEMRARGIRVDLDRAAHYTTQLTHERDTLVRTALRGARPSAARELAVLFTEEGHAPGRTATGEPSITKAWLKHLGASSTLASALLRVRWIDKQLSTYLRPLPRLAIHGRIHGQLHGLRSDEGGTVSGRLSSSKPNLQNLSAKADPEGIVRGCYLPEPDAAWTALDYSGQEARLAVHEAYRRRCVGARAVVQAYQREPRLDLYAQLRDAVNGVLDASHAITRDQAKVLFLAAMYGMGDTKCGDMLGVPPAVASTVLAAFRHGVPWLAQLVRTVKQEATTHALIETPLLQRRARFVEVATGSGPWMHPHGVRYSTHTALNRTIQGGAADQTKVALVALWRMGAVLHASVHDEIDTSTATVDDAVAQAQCMADVVPLAVPVLVDIERGPSWGAATALPDVTIASRRLWRHPRPVGA